jgi:hypothetical protein
MRSEISGSPKALSSEEAAAIVANLPVWTRSVAELEGWDAQQLYAATQAAIAEEGHFPAPLAQRLDEVLILKFVQLLSTRHATPEDFHALELLIGALANDDVRDQLDTMPAHYASRWQVLSDAMAVAQKLQDFRTATAQRVGSSTHVWEVVGEAVLRAGVRGASWPELAELIKTVGNGPKSQGGISQLLTAMQARGLLDAIQRGRNKFFMPGPNLRRTKKAEAKPVEKVLYMVAEAELSPLPIAVTRR